MFIYECMYVYMCIYNVCIYICRYVFGSFYIMRHARVRVLQTLSLELSVVGLDPGRVS